MDTIKNDKRTKEYKATVDNSGARPQRVTVGQCHFHNVVFFAGKNFGEKIDIRAHKTPDGKPITMEYDRTEKELVIRGGKHESFIPSSNIVSYSPIETVEKIPLVQPTSNVSANPSINAQVSGPHDHVFAGLGQGQTGVGGKVK